MGPGASRPAALPCPCLPQLHPPQLLLQRCHWPMRTMRGTAHLHARARSGFRTRTPTYASATTGGASTTQVPHSCPSTCTRQQRTGAAPTRSSPPTHPPPRCAVTYHFAELLRHHAQPLVQSVWRQMSGQMACCINCLHAYHGAKRQYAEEHEAEVVTPLLASMQLLDGERLVAWLQQPLPAEAVQPPPQQARAAARARPPAAFGRTGTLRLPPALCPVPCALLCGPGPAGPLPPCTARTTLCHSTPAHAPVCPPSPARAPPLPSSPPPLPPHGMHTHAHTHEAGQRHV